MDEIAKTIFAPIYPVIAEKIIGKSGITKGTCIDLGSGPASLAIAVAQQSDLSVIALDYSDDMHESASRNIKEAGLSERIRLLCGDVHAMPLDDDSADLIISRGSMFFWNDIHTAFREIYRVLKPGGMTYIGGGFGNKELRDEISATMIKKNPDWKEFNRKNISPENAERFQIMLDEIGVPKYEIILGDEGFWIVISKTAGNPLA
ncbi:class I SAM-dependent methyltransferase [Methanogenium sp. MK-MG]|uniref:class I SAM-dependent methyltransferase n=1 Tax=Methanogenium sp. MK-MG TaxID=2599926 RepID=UPI0020B11947|nr:class I SAM-dependent methyltransferase [Methanogenium sp. MK-MG]